MKLFIDTDWFEMIQDLSQDKQNEILRAILSYPNGDSDTNIWKKIILPKLEQQEKLYKEKVQRFAENRQKRQLNKSDKISDEKSEQTSIKKSDKISNRCQNVNVDVNENVNNNSRKDNKKLSTVRKRSKQVLTAHQEIADYLVDNLSVRLNRKISSRGWADEIRKLCDNGNIDPSRIRGALEWHFSKYDRPYRIEIQSAKALREKFSRLEVQMKRAAEEENKPFYM